MAESIEPISALPRSTVAKFSIRFFTLILRRLTCVPVVHNRRPPSSRLCQSLYVRMNEPREHGRTSSARESLISIGESHGNGRTPMRIWGSQWSHLLLHRALFCFRYIVCFILANSVVLRRPECTSSSVNRGLNSVRMSMGEHREHGRIAWEWRIA